MAYLNNKPIFFSARVNIKEPDIIVKSWADVQRVVREGKAKKVFSIGDQFQCGHGDYGILTWDVIGIDHDIPSNPNFKHSLTLQLHYCFPSSQVQTHNTDSDTWKDSFVRWWLNVPAGDYKDPGFPGVVYDHSFVYNLDQEFLDVVGEVQKKTRSRDGNTLDITSDKFFLLSCEEVFGTGVPWTGYQNYGVGEGEPYQYYIDRSQHTVPNRGDDTGRIKYKGSFRNNRFIIDTTPVNGWGLRSPYSYVTDNNPGSTWAVFNRGHIGTMNATAEISTATYLAPACCIY